MYGGSFHNEEDGTAEGAGLFFPINEAWGQRNNNKAYLDYFRDLRWYNWRFNNAIEEEDKADMRFSIFSNKEEEGGARAFARVYENDRTEFGTFPKNPNLYNEEMKPYYALFPNVISVCVAR